MVWYSCSEWTACPMDTWNGLVLQQVASYTCNFATSRLLRAESPGSSTLSMHKLFLDCFFAMHRLKCWSLCLFLIASQSHPCAPSSRSLIIPIRFHTWSTLICYRSLYVGIRVQSKLVQATSTASSSASLLPTTWVKGVGYGGCLYTEQRSTCPALRNTHIPHILHLGSLLLLLLPLHCTLIICNIQNKCGPK